MELRLLEQFVAVGEELHFGRAAERLFMSQPPLSMAMQRLEQEMGVSLLARNRRGVQLTAAGAVFLGEARQVLASVARAVELARQTAEGHVGRLRLGCMGPAVAAGLSDIVQSFMAAHPDVQMQLDEQISFRQLEMLRSGALDLAVVRLHGRHPDFCHTRLFCRDVYVAAVPADHPLARQCQVSLADVRGESIILYPRRMGPELYDAVIASCHEAGFSPHIVQEVATKSTTLALVASGLGIAFVPASLAKAGYNGVQFVPMRHGLPPVEMFWAWSKESMNPVTARFLEHAERSAPIGITEKTMPLS